MLEIGRASAQIAFPYTGQRSSIRQGLLDNGYVSRGVDRRNAKVPYLREGMHSGQALLHELMCVCLSVCMCIPHRQSDIPIFATSFMNLGCVMCVFSRSKAARTLGCLCCCLSCSLNRALAIVIKVACSNMKYRQGPNNEVCVHPCFGKSKPPGRRGRLPVIVCVCVCVCV